MQGVSPQGRACHPSPHLSTTSQFACRAGRQDKDASPLRGILLLQEMEGMSTKLPLLSFPHAQHRLSFKQTPWPLSCQGTRAALESEFARLLPWSKESETLPLETKQSIRHFTCQKYIQPPKKEILPAKEPATKPSIPPVKQSPVSGISTGIQILCPAQNHPKPNQQQGQVMARGDRRRAPGHDQESWWGPEALA